MKSLIVVFGALLLIICLPGFFHSIHDARVEIHEQTFASVTTGAETDADVTLSEAVFNDSLSSIGDITSDLETDAPFATSYDEVSHVVNVDGLMESETRTLVVEYGIASTVIEPGLDIFLTLLPWFYVFTILGMLSGAIYAFFD